MLNGVKYIINGKFLSQSITGVQRYARELLPELDKIINAGEFLLIYPDNVDNVPPMKNIATKCIGPFTGNLWEQVTLPLYAMRHRCIVINLCGPSPIISPGVVVLHDVTFKAYPKTFTWKFRMWYDILYKNAIKRSLQLITISRFSEDEIRKYYPTHRKFFIVPNSWQHFEAVQTNLNVLKKYDLKENAYYFSLGSIKPNKNLKFIIDTATQYPSEKFVVAGSINNKVFLSGLKVDIPSNVAFIGYVTDSEAKSLMKYCKAFIFPSLYEGFGIPPLEAICAGCNSVIVADIPVMHEIFGDDVSYIGEKALDSKPCDSKVLKRFSWNKSAIRLLEAIKATKKDMW